MAGLLDFLNSDDARLGMGLLAAGGPQTDPTKTGFGYALQSAMNSSDAAKQTALQRQLLQAQAQEAQQKAALDAMNVKRLGAWNQMALGAQPDGSPAPVQPPDATTNLAPTPTPGLLGATPAVGAGPGAPGTLSQAGGGSTVGPQPVAPTAPAGAAAGGAAGAFPYKLPGISDQASRSLALMVGPDAYMKSYMDKSGILSDFAKSLHDAGIPEGSAQWNQAMKDNIEKQNYIAPVVGRPGGTVLDRNGMPRLQLPTAIEGAQASFDPQGRASFTASPGAQTVIAQGQQAKDVGKAAATNVVAYDANNKPIYSTGLQGLQRAQGQAPTGNPADFFAQPTGGFAGTGGNAPAPTAAAGPTNAPGQKDAALINIGMRESGMQNIPNQPKPGEPPSTAEGYFQITRDTWKDGAKLAGVNLSQYPNPMAAPFAVQHAVASALYDARGETPWASSAANASKFPGAWAVGGKGGPTPPTAPQAGPGITNVVANSPDIPPPPGQDTTIRPQLPPGAEQAANSMQTGLTGHWKDLSDASSRANTAITQLQNIRMYAKQAILGTESGRLSYLNGILALGGIGAADTAKEASDALDKNRSQLISTLRLGAGQAGTDAFQTISDAATPGRQMNIGALNDAVDQLISQQRLNQAKTNFLSPYANTAARDPASFGKAELAFDNAADPRAFQLSSMAPDNAKAYLAKMPPDQKRELMTKVQQLEKMGAL